MNSIFTIDKSAVSSVSLKDLEKGKQELDFLRNFKAVVVGGGTGSPASVKALRSLGIKTDVVVAMADDGGSTGILRKSAGVTPPGDVRKCLCALAEDENDALTKAFAYRFVQASNHAIGNLVLCALEQATGSFYDAILKCEEILKCTGHVYPSTLENIFLSAETFDGLEISGQAVATKSKTALKKVNVVNDQGKTPKAFERAVSALEDADLIVLGPGSLFTSIIPNILIGEIADAINKSKAKVVFVCGIADIQGETWGLAPYEHVSALEAHGLAGRINFCIVNSADLQNKERAESDAEDIRTISATDEDVSRIKNLGIVPILRDLENSEVPGRHDLFALRDAFSSVLSLSAQGKSEG